MISSDPWGGIGLGWATGAPGGSGRTSLGASVNSDSRTSRWPTMLSPLSTHRNRYLKVIVPSHGPEMGRFVIRLTPTPTMCTVAEPSV